MLEDPTKNTSLVVVNYNAGNLLAKCVESALHQVDEILIVDNASTDFSLEKCSRQFINQPQVRFIVNQNNLGFSSACNTGFSKSKNDVVLFLNPDCLLEGNAVAKLHRALTSDSRIGMVGGLLRNPDGSEQGGGRRAFPSPWRSFVRACGLHCFQGVSPRLFSDFHLHKQSLPDHSIEVEAISGACMMVKREAIEDVGLWDEGYFLHCEDLDWCMRFKLKGWKVMFVPDAKITHAAGACSRNRPIFVEWHKHKGMMRFYRKFFRHQYPGFMMWLVSLGVWLRFSLITIYYSAHHVGKWFGR